MATQTAILIQIKTIVAIVIAFDTLAGIVEIHIRAYLKALFFVYKNYIVRRDFDSKRKINLAKATYFFVFKYNIIGFTLFTRI